jgi:hypothetical protein
VEGDYGHHLPPRGKGPHDDTYDTGYGPAGGAKGQYGTRQQQVHTCGGTKGRRGGEKGCNTAADTIGFHVKDNFFLLSNSKVNGCEDPRQVKVVLLVSYVSYL